MGALAKHRHECRQSAARLSCQISRQTWSSSSSISEQGAGGEISSPIFREPCSPPLSSKQWARFSYPIFCGTWSYGVGFRLSVKKERALRTIENSTSTPVFFPRVLLNYHAKYYWTCIIIICGWGVMRNIADIFSLKLSGITRSSDTSTGHVTI